MEEGELQLSDCIIAIQEWQYGSPSSSVFIHAIIMMHTPCSDHGHEDIGFISPCHYCAS